MSSATIIDQAVDHNGLVATLRSTDISVPARTKGRLSEHTERWSMCRLLASLGEAGRITYPVALTHSDRPDFVLKSGLDEIGVEITEAIPKGYAAYCALAEKEFAGGLLDIGLFRPGSPNYSPEQMRDFLRADRLTSPAWKGNSVEEEWAAYIRDSLDKKLVRLSQASFRKYKFNWLSIYDNLPLPNLHLNDAMELLHPSLMESWLKSPYFDRVFIEQGQSIICVSKVGWEVIPLKNLWTSEAKTRAGFLEQTDTSL